MLAAILFAFISGIVIGAGVTHTWTVRVQRRPDQARSGSQRRRKD